MLDQDSLQAIVELVSKISGDATVVVVWYMILTSVVPLAKTGAICFTAYSALRALLGALVFERKE